MSYINLIFIICSDATYFKSIRTLISQHLRSILVTQFNTCEECFDFLGYENMMRPKYIFISSEVFNKNVAKKIKSPKIRRKTQNSEYIIMDNHGLFCHELITEMYGIKVIPLKKNGVPNAKSMDQFFKELL